MKIRADAGRVIDIVVVDIAIIVDIRHISIIIVEVKRRAGPPQN